MNFQIELIKSLQRHATEVALEIGEKKISYAELLNAADKITAYLLNQDLGKETIIGINSKDRFHIICAMIGIMNARCVFVTLDTTLPGNRLAEMMENLDLKHVITHQGNSRPLEREGLKKYCIEDLLTTNIGSLQYPEYHKDDSIYVYFTSGSTGTPKGIVGRNCSLLQYIEWEVDEFHIDSNSRVSQFISPYFDAFLRDVFVPLFAGGTICVPPNEEDFYSSGKMISWIDASNISLIHCVPSLFRVINSDLLSVRYFKSLKYILMSGEKINPVELNHWYEIFDCRIQLVNLYGTTETTMIRSYYKISPEDVELSKIPIGSPIPGTELLIAKNDLKPCNTLVPGDLYIISNYVTKGYLNAMELTEEKFLKIKEGTPDETIAFKTGDRARKLSGGSIELLGREDRQIKLRGVRIELDEVEANLIKSDVLENALVVLQTDENKNESLVAFIIGKNGLKDKIDLKQEIQHFAKKYLPKYMIPANFVVVNEYPLLSNGKINYKELLEYKILERNIIAPVNEMEERILSIWKEILGDKDISTDDSFHLIGGNSLTIMSLISRINKVFGIRISLSELFKNPTVKKQVEFITKANKGSLIVVPKAPPASHYPLSSAQKRLYFLYAFDKNATAYNMTQIVSLYGKLDEKRLKDVIRKLAERHESLRTSFKMLDKQPVQKIAKDVELGLELFQSDDEQCQSIVEDFVRPFDLAVSPLFRVGLIGIAEEEHVLMFDIHHIISDGISLSVLIKDFMALYHDEALPLLKLQYKDFATWQQTEDQQRKIMLQREFWIRKFAENPVPIDLPADFPRPLLKSYEGKWSSFEIDEKTTQGLYKIAESEGATIFMTLLTVFNILLAKLSGREDIVIGTPITGRRHMDIEAVVGMFVNMIPLRNYPKGDITFRYFLAAVKAEAISSFDNQDYAYETLIDDLNIERNTSRNPLFDIVFSFQNFETSTLEIPGLTLKPYNQERQNAKFDLNLFAFEKDEKIALSFEYCSKLFNPETIEGFITYFQKIVTTVISDIDIHIADIEIISKQEKAQLLNNLNNTQIGYPEHKTVVDLFREQAKRTPRQIALKFKEQTITYQELNQHTDQLSFRLVNQGVKTNDVVGLLVDRSIEAIIGMIGILKAGAAYLPIDIDYPESRIDYMIKDSGTNILLTLSGLKRKVPEGIATLFIDQEDGNLVETNDIVDTAKPSDLCYVIYTSGTTGQPKGVMVEHRNVVRLFFNNNPLFDFNKSDVWTMCHSHCFDFSVWEIYGALLFGGKLVIIPKMVARDTNAYLKILKEEKVTVLNQTPSAFYNLLEEEVSYPDKTLNLRYIIFGGEALSPVKLKSWKDKYEEVKLINMYGITETTVHVTYKEIGLNEIDNNISNIGKPIPTLSAYVLDSHMRLVPLGTVGELFVGGAGVSRGYLGKEELTKSRFIPNPYNKKELLYRTGDLTRILQSGEIEYLGRIDDQIQLRGFRIELGEIENQLMVHGQIQKTIVLVREKNDNQYLAAYYESEHEIKAADLRGYLIEKLPDYMMPSHFVHLNNFPLTSSGKLDKAALPDPQIDFEEGDLKAYSAVEEQLVEIWAEVLDLDIELIAVNRSFFELGGNSLMIVRLNTMINDTFDWNISIPDMFRYTTILSLVDYVNGKNKSKEKLGWDAQEELIGLQTALKVFDK